MRGTWWRHAALVGVIALVAAACGGDEPDDGGDGEQPATTDVTVIHGTTDSIVSLDPAGSYDLGSWQIINNTMEGLLTIPVGGNQPEPALAESCDFDDPQTYTCTLKQGVTFHDGSPFTAEDVAFSMERNISLDDPNGACSLLGSLAPCAEWNADSVEVVDDFTVTFHLAAPDATWPFILTTPAAFIVPSETYATDALQADGELVGTGPYSMAEYRAGEQIVLEAFADYHGEAPANERVIVQYFDRSSALKLAIEQGEVDVAWRTFTPTDISDLEGADGVEVLSGPGAEIRYLVFNLSFDPVSEVAVRKAVAQTIDRESIAENVYNGTVEPLYSMIPTTYAGHTDDFAEMYGETPDPEAAAQTLADAGVDTPVDLEIWWTPTHYGDLSADEYAEIKRSLEESGLFTVSLKSTEWDQYSEAAFTDQYPAYQLGWFPDYLDADNYVTSFYRSDSFLNIHYDNERVDELLAQQKASTDQAEREQIFEEIQQIVAEEVPIIPVWQGSQVAAAREGVTGVQDTLDATYVLRYWLIGKSA